MKDLKTAERAKNRGKYRSRGQVRYAAMTDVEKRRLAENSLQSYHRLRKSAFEHLGGLCVRCGFSDVRALQIDHVMSDGADHRRGRSNWRILRDVLGTAPGERFQLVCANCNWILRAERGESGKRPAA